MFFTYLERELRRRMRQSAFIALGLALGIGLVITVTAAATGVKNAQGTVLKSLYGVGTDATVTKTPAAGSAQAPARSGSGSGPAPPAGPQLAPRLTPAPSAAPRRWPRVPASSVTTVAGLDDVAAAAGGLTLNNRTISGTVPAINANSGGAAAAASVAAVAAVSSGQSFRASFNTSSFGVERGRSQRRRARPAQLGQAELGPHLHRCGRLS